jgi:hypothetical protein
MAASTRVTGAVAVVRMPPTVAVGEQVTEPAPPELSPGLPMRWKLSTFFGGWVACAHLFRENAMRSFKGVEQFLGDGLTVITMILLWVRTLKHVESRAILLHLLYAEPKSTAEAA